MNPQCPDPSYDPIRDFDRVEARNEAAASRYSPENIEKLESLNPVHATPAAETTTEYNLKEAGAFSEVDLLDFQQSELAKGKHITKIWITQLQANHLANSMNHVEPKQTGKKLVDYWNIPKSPVKLTSIHEIEIGVDYE